jgi:hypothetical protein
VPKFFRKIRRVAGQKRCKTPTILVEVGMKAGWDALRMPRATSSIRAGAVAFIWG